MEEQKSGRVTLILDGFNLFLRSYMVNETMNNAGEPYGGTVGFLKFLGWTVENTAAKKVILVWEHGGGSPRRKSIFPEYKANRTKVKELNSIYKTSDPAKLHLQDKENRLKQLLATTSVLKNLPVCQVFIPDTECDDIIGYLAKYKIKGKKIIVSSDRDFYQLLADEDVKIYEPTKRTYVDSAKVLDQFGIAPRNFCLARTIIGDDSDGIPGVNGVGFKTAAKFFKDILSDTSKDYNTDSILEECKKQVPTSKRKVYKHVLEAEEVLRRNWDLMYLDATSNLSSQQISKVDYIVDNYTPICNQLTCIKTLLKEGISWDDKFDFMFKQLRNHLV